MRLHISLISLATALGRTFRTSIARWGSVSRRSAVPRVIIGASIGIGIVVASALIAVVIRIGVCSAGSVVAGAIVISLGVGTRASVSVFSRVIGHSEVD